MTFGSNLPRLAVRELPVRAEKWAKRAELEPAGIELTPLLEVRIFPRTGVKELLGFDIAVFDAESAYVHGPVRYAADTEVESGAYLGFHVLPSGCDVAAPGGCAVALEAGKSASGKQEYAAVRVRRTLPVVDCVGVHQCIGVEILGRRAECSRPAQSLAVFHIGAVADIWLGCVHPPGIYAQRIVVFVNLLPEKTACIFAVSVIESIQVTRSYPVPYAILESACVHPALSVKFFVMIGRDVEFRPDGNHHSPAQRVD